MTIDNTILVNRDYAQLRAEFTQGITNDKVRAALEPLEDGPFYYPQLFTNAHGRGAVRKIKNRVKLINDIKSILDKMLLQEEEVRYVTTGLYTNTIEHLFLGWAAVLINQTIFVFTNYRVIMINANHRNRPLHMKWHLPYDQIESYTRGGFIPRSINFKLKDGLSLTFKDVAKGDRTALKVFINDMLGRVNNESFHLPHHQCRDNLCPSCYKPVPKYSYDCKFCSDAFIEPKTPALLSLALPCLGDLYLGHWFLAATECFGYLAYWLVFAVMVAEKGSILLPFFVIVLFAIHGIDAVFTAYMANKGLVSKRNAWGRTP